MSIYTKEAMHDLVNLLLSNAAVQHSQTNQHPAEVSGKEQERQEKVRPHRP